MWFTIQRRRMDTIDFQRTWNEYREGFGDPDLSMWVGLDKIHTLTNGDCITELKVDLVSQTHHRTSGIYSSFRILDESNKYRMILSGHDSTTRPILADCIDQMFSTPDYDNDISGRYHCAHIMYAGWWYKACGNSNLNGMMTELPDDSIGQKDQAFWSPLDGERSMLGIDMQIRCID